MNLRRHNWRCFRSLSRGALPLRHALKLCRVSIGLQIARNSSHVQIKNPGQHFWRWSGLSVGWMCCNAFPPTLGALRSEQLALTRLLVRVCRQHIPTPLKPNNFGFHAVDLYPISSHCLPFLISAAHAGQTECPCRTHQPHRLMRRSNPSLLILRPS